MEAYRDNNEVYSKKVKAGKRTYFFDVKATRAGDYYMTITESRRTVKEEGNFYEKNKIFLYKEDLNKFVHALNGTVGHIKKELLPDDDFSQFAHQEGEESLEGDDTSKNVPPAPESADEMSLTFGVYTADKPSEVVKQFRPILDALEESMSDTLGKPVAITMQVASAVKRTEQSVGGGGVETQAELLDVKLVPTGGAPWKGSPAGQFPLTVDDPDQFGFFEEGAALTLDITRES